MNTQKHSSIHDDSLSISFLQASASDTLKDGWSHKKTMPFAIIAQPQSGAYIVTCNGERVIARSGETVLVPANTEVTFEHSAPNGGCMSARWVHINWQLFKSIDLTQLLEIPLKRGGEQSRNFGRLISEFLAVESAQSMPSLQAMARKNELGFALLQLLLECSKQNEEISEYLSRTKRLQAVFAYMTLHLREPLTIESLASVACLSTSRFFTVFKEVMSISPMDYLRKQRITEASRLLLSTNMSVGQIASITGFINQFHFSRVFKEQIGMNPREYRKGDL